MSYSPQAAKARNDNKRLLMLLAWKKAGFPVPEEEWNEASKELDKWLRTPKNTYDYARPLDDPAMKLR